MSGSEYAGLFSNNDKLSNQFLPLAKSRKSMENASHKNYDKLMNSKNADVQNINYVGGQALLLQLSFCRDLF